MITVIGLLLAARALAIELEFGLGGGYDDNLYASSESPGAAFWQCEISAFQSLDLPAGTRLSFSTFADYRDYNGYDDNYQIGLGCEISRRPAELPLNIDLYSQVSSRRNPLIPDYELDALNLGLRLRPKLTPRLDLALTAEISWEDYVEEYVNGSNRGGTPLFGSNNGTNGGTGLGAGGKGNSNGKGHMNAGRDNNGSRHDRLFSLRLDGIYALNPELEIGGNLLYRIRRSTIDNEERQAYGAGLDICWRPRPDFSCSAFTQAERMAYRYERHQQDLVEDNLTFGLDLSWQTGPWTISGGWLGQRYRSDINLDNYHRNQWLGRLSYSF